MFSIKLPVIVSALERKLLVKALAENNGELTKAGTSLGLSLRQVRYLVKKYAIDKREFFNEKTSKNIVR